MLSTYCRRDIEASRIGANVLNVLRMLSAISRSARRGALPLGVEAADEHLVLHHALEVEVAHNPRERLQRVIPVARAEADLPQAERLRSSELSAGE